MILYRLISDEWIDLGRFIVNVNRGHGQVSLFYARNAYKASVGNSKDSVDSHTTETIDDADMEKQQIVYLTRDELLNALLKGEVAEIKWSACVAMALLHDMQGEKNESIIRYVQPYNIT